MADICQDAADASWEDDEFYVDEPPIPKPKRSPLWSFYINPTFSDIKVLVGPNKEIFELHRIVLSTRSNYFKVACKESFKEGKAREIWIKEMDPKVFRQDAYQVTYPPLILRDFCAYSQVSERFHLRACALTIQKAGYLRPKALSDLSKDAPGSSMCLGIFMDVCQDNLSSVREASLRIH
ncbi:hypothetical protein H072_498 [Dactylellina haptotyla CBS 200.50]|uniref:BTB domain-containing protein n=1 Tax=Dactylellina haptotyla (strain CBS 200.50) TaxID=1284197 RepID=S8AWX4_DACHA|nr:hypothetical protein H072_498 [Dactylellina haptotyla CBS 200.50]